MPPAGRAERRRALPSPSQPPRRRIAVSLCRTACAPCHCRGMLRTAPRPLVPAPLSLLASLRAAAAARLAPCPDAGAAAGIAPAARQPPKRGSLQSTASRSAAAAAAAAPPALPPGARASSGVNPRCLLGSRVLDLTDNMAEIGVVDDVRRCISHCPAARPLHSTHHRRAAASCAAPSRHPLGAPATRSPTAPNAPPGRRCCWQRRRARRSRCCTFGLRQRGAGRRARTGRST